MEEEYRMQKTQSDIQQVLSATKTNGVSHVRDLDMGTAVIHEDGTVVRPSIDDQVSTRGIKSTSPTIQPVSPADANGTDNEPASAVPTIRISTDSSQETDSKEEENGQEENSADEDDEDEDETEESESKKTVDRKEKGKAKEVTHLERPEQAAGEGDQNVNEASPAPAQEPFSFSNKRLCERWLDNLFMVLYEVSYPSFVIDLSSFNNKLT